MRDCTHPPNPDEPEPYSLLSAHLRLIFRQLFSVGLKSLVGCGSALGTLLVWA